MKNDLILIIDMQKVYEPGEAWCCPGMERAAGNIRKLLDAPGEKDVVFTVFIAPENPRGAWKDYNRVYADINADRRASAMTDSLLPYTRRFPVYEKSTYSSLSIPQVREAVQKAGRVAICGVVAECCVLATVEALIDEGAKVLYLKDAVAGQTPEFEALTEKIVESFSEVHTRLMTVEEYLSEA